MICIALGKIFANMVDVEDRAFNPLKERCHYTTIKVSYNSAHRSASSLWHNLVPGCKLAGAFAS